MIKSLFRTSFIVLLVCLASGLALAQDDAPAAPVPFAINPCSDEALPCDVIVTAPEEIVGLWSVYFNGVPAVIRYKDDGTWLMADSAANTAGEPLEDYPSGTYWFGDGIFTTTDPGLIEVVPDCAEGDYILRLISVGDQPVAVNMEPVEDCFDPRRADWEYGMIWVGADETTSTAVTAASEDDVWYSMPRIACPAAESGESYPCEVLAENPRGIRGIWRQVFGQLGEGGTAFVRYNGNGSYFFADTPENTRGSAEGFPFGDVMFQDNLMYIAIELEDVPEFCVRGTYNPHVLQLGSQPVAINFMQVEDECPDRIADLSQALIWVGEN